METGSKLNKWYTFNEDGSVKYCFDGYKPVVLPNNPTEPTLRDLGLSLVYPFYNEKERFDVQFKTWSNYNEILKRCLYINIIDDSSNPPVMSWLPRSIVKRLDFNLSVHRITKDVKWNTPAALNLGVYTAKTDWVLFMDSDCVIEDPMITKLVTELSPDKKLSYCFMRKRVTSDPVKAQIVRPLTCCILIHKHLFEEVGGFDEDFVGEKSGGYGMFDNDFNARLTLDRKNVIVDVVVTEYLELGENIQERTGVSADIIGINKRLWRDKHTGRLPRNTERLKFEWSKELDVERW